MSAEEKAVEETAKTVRHYLDCILAAPLSEFGLLLKDQISYWRFKNQVNAALTLPPDFLPNDRYGYHPAFLVFRR
jgi:hypothetical protein